LKNNENVYINSLQASDLYEYQKGKPVSSNFVGMISYSLELIKLKKLGMKTYLDRNGKQRSNDVINVKYDMRAKEYSDILANDYMDIIRDRLRSLKEKSITMETTSKQKKNDFAIAETFKLLGYLELVEELEPSSTTVSELRTELYGMEFMYNGIDYVVYKRTSAKSRTGQCQFIKKKFREKAIRWARMGMNMDGLSLKDGVDFPSLLAYESLVSSSIEDTIKIHPKNILVVHDVISRFTAKASVISNDGDTDDLISIKNEAHPMESDIFDGESILDESYFPIGKGSMLLRMHMFKSCAFNGRVQKFLIDNCPDDILYEDWVILDMFGMGIYAKDIHMITTPNSLKALKFYKRKKTKKGMFEHWKKKVIEDDCIFGICKYEKPSNKGYSSVGKIMNQMSYQMINSMPLSSHDLGKLVRHEFDFMDKLQKDDEFFLQHLKDNINIMNSNEMLYDLAKNNHSIIKTDLFKKKRKGDISSHKTLVKRGKIRLEGDYCTICQNPKEMMYHAIRRLPLLDDMLNIDEWLQNMEVIGNQCSTTLHDYGREYTAFRNPHTAPSNVLILHNIESDFISTYMNGTDNIVFTNAIGFEINRILSGQDVDSDTLEMLDHPVLLETARKCFGKYDVCDNNVSAMKMDYSVSVNNMAKIDNILSTSQANIGKVVNLGQSCMSAYWEEIGEYGQTERASELLDAVDICTILSEIAIDMAKKMYNVDFGAQVNKINAILNADEKPLFFKYVSKNKTAKFRKFDTPMDRLNILVDKIPRQSWDSVNSIFNLIKKHDFKVTKKNKRQRIKFDGVLSKYINTRRAIFAKTRHGGKSDIADEISIEIERALSEAMIELGKYKASASTMYHMFQGLMNEEIETKELTSYMNALYKMDKRVFLSLFKTG
jgi:hypothetical protein